MLTSKLLSSYLIRHASFLCNSDPHHLAASFITVFEEIATQNEAHLKVIFLKWGQLSKKVCSVLEQINRRHNHNLRKKAIVYVEDCNFGPEEKQYFSSEFLQFQNNNYVIYGVILNDTLICFQCLDTTTRSMMSIP